MSDCTPSVVLLELVAEAFITQDIGGKNGGGNSGNSEGNEEAAQTVENGSAFRRRVSGGGSD